MNRNGTRLLVEIPTICLPTVAIPEKNPCPSLLIVTPDPTRNEVLSKVRLALAFNVFAVPEPVIILDVALLFIVVPVTPVKFDPSPTKLEAVTTPAVTLNPDASNVAAVPTLNVVAVTIPVKNPLPSGLKVIPDPTRELLLNVETPATSNIPVLTLSVEAIPVSVDPSPTKLVAVTIPVTSIPDSLDVTADPTDV